MLRGVYCLNSGLHRERERGDGDTPARKLSACLRSFINSLLERLFCSDWAALYLSLAAFVILAGVRVTEPGTFFGYQIH
jgi:hypothetical protein